MARGEKRAAKFGHDCALCHHPQRERIERLYLEFWEPREIARHVKTKPLHTRTVQAHMVATGLEYQRGINPNMRKVLLSRILTEGMRQLPKSRIRPTTLLKIVQHMDNLDGLIVNKHEDVGPRTVAFVTVPMPGGSVAAPILPPAREDVLTIEGSVEEVPAVLPGGEK